MSELRDLRKQEQQLRNTLESVSQFKTNYKPEVHAGELVTRIEMLDAAMKKFYVVRRKIELILEETDEEEVVAVKETPEEKKARLSVRTDERNAENAHISKEVEDMY
ncbi:hypothetical protein pipiens_019934, partial [Culex pipiens pipiens]